MTLVGFSFLLDINPIFFVGQLVLLLLDFDFLVCTNCLWLQNFLVFYQLRIESLVHLELPFCTEAKLLPLVRPSPVLQTLRCLFPHHLGIQHRSVCSTGEGRTNGSSFASVQKG